MPWACRNRRLAVTCGLSAAFLFTPARGGLSRHQPARLDPQFIRTTVTAVAKAVREQYFDRDVAARVGASLVTDLAEGRYARVKSLESLAGKLTRDLFATTHDKHFAVSVVPDAAVEAARSPADEAGSRAIEARRSNFGVQRVEILSGNVGYLNLTSFYRPNEAREVISAAMSALRHADALILDMRENTGGSPDTVALLASYLFDEPGLALFDIVHRSGGPGGRFATAESALPERNEARPVYVLTAARTFSAGEGLAFLLQERRRAEVVGERTAGAANPGRPYRINDRIEVTIPNGKVRSAVTGRNWEGVGVLPDIKVAASEALHVAHVRALRTLLAAAPPGPWHDTLNRQLKALAKWR